MCTYLRTHNIMYTTPCELKNIKRRREFQIQPTYLAVNARIYVYKYMYVDNGITIEHIIVPYAIRNMYTYCYSYYGAPADMLPFSLLHYCG